MTQHCTSLTKNGAQCSKKTSSLNGKCYFHSNSENELETLKSKNSELRKYLNGLEHIIHRVNGMSKYSFAMHAPGSMQSLDIYITENRPKFL